KGSGLCRPGSLDPKKVEGDAVLCKRGANARVEKGKVVLDAGGVGMVLYNAKADEELVSDPHYLPAVQVRLADGQAIKALLAKGPPATEVGGVTGAPGNGLVRAAL